MNDSEAYHLRARATVDAFDLMQIRDDKYLKHCIERQLVEAISHKVREVACVTNHALDPKTGQTYVDLDVYVFTPTEFRQIVLAESRRMFDCAMRGPHYNQY